MGGAVTAWDPARYARQLTVLGADGQDALARARVLVIGAGGLGTPALLYLAGAGVGTIGVVDDDTVEASNLHRQVVHSTANVGEAKVTSAAARIADLNPEVAVVAHEEAFTASSALGLARGYDLVVDGSDNFATRYVASDACEILGIPHVWGSVLRYEGQLSVFHAGHGPTYRDVFPALPPAGSVPSCAEAGVLGVVPGIVGMAMAAEALKLVLGVGRPLVGRLATYDALDARWEEIPIHPDPARQPVTAMTAEEPGVAAPSDQEILVPELAAALESPRPPALLDVREPWEAAIAEIPGSFLVPLGAIEERLREGWRPDPGPLVVYCAAGVRSLRAVALLTEAGVPSRSLAGGVDAWQAAGYEVRPGSEVPAWHA